VEKVTLDVPILWADHHVVKVREALISLEGVEDVYASSAWKQVLVHYDETKTNQTTIEKALAEAGYPVGEGETPMLVQALGVDRDIHRDPRWAVLGARVTETDESDLRLSGEFRRY
jgi:copper chaperone CopZ